ncbi:MAG TPA: hypothetical protein VFX98_04810 [Longimicrobiaceae bacterium]|nr:hypothetical protein [Longimicrobiaceae bacterium]
MRKLTLDIETLNVQSFETTAAAENGEGTVFGHEPTRGHHTRCASAFDACPTGFCATNGCDTTLCTVETCPATYDCPSAVDACPSGRGCTIV